MTNEIVQDDLVLENYQNSAVVGSIGETQMTVVDAIWGNHVMGNNTFLAGRKGIGKTQIMSDFFYGKYGGNGVPIEGRTDLKIDEVFKTVRGLDKLAKGASLDDIFVLKDVDLRFLCVDELTLCPEITQAQLLSIMNGYLLHNNRKIKLGDGDCAGIAAGNLAYAGTFQIQQALQSRLHLFLDMDYWEPTYEDWAEVDGKNHFDPKVKDCKVNDISDKIVYARHCLKSQHTHETFSIFARFLHLGLNYCEKFPTAKHSKNILGDRWPSICTEKNCALNNTLCAKVKGIDPRAVEAVITLAKGLEYVALLKNPKTQKGSVDALLLAAKLVLPYSEAISRTYLRTDQAMNNPTVAASLLAEEIRNEIEAQTGSTDSKGEFKPGPLFKSISYASNGALEQCPYDPGNKKWLFIKPVLKRMDEKAKQKGG